MKKIIEFILGTSILWLPILGCMLAGWLSEIITMDMIIKVIYFLIPILIFLIIKINLEESREAEQRVLKK